MFYLLQCLKVREVSLQKRSFLFDKELGLVDGAMLLANESNGGIGK